MPNIYWAITDCFLRLVAWNHPLFGFILWKAGSPILPLQAFVRQVPTHKPYANRYLS